MKIKFFNIGLDYDKEYGCEKRTGWSISIDGHYLVQLEPSLIRAIWKSIFQTSPS